MDLKLTMVSTLSKQIQQKTGSSVPVGVIASLSNQRIIINETALSQRNEALAKV